MKKLKIYYLIVFLATISMSLQGQEKPNFLFIFTDDQTYETIHALNNPEIETPNMDRLVDQGVTFTHCYNQGSWSGAVCVASRSMLITGQTVFRSPQNKKYLDSWARFNKSDTITEVPLWTEVLSKNGYETFITGKWHNSDYALLKSFDKATAIGKGFYETLDESGSNKQGYNRPSEQSQWTPWDERFTGHWTPKVKDIVYDQNGTKKLGEPYKIKKHTSELYADAAISYLKERTRAPEKPFFMYVAFNAPHDPRQSPKEFVDKYPPEKIALPPSYAEQHPFDQGDAKTRDEVLAPFPRTKEAVQLHLSEYYAIITHFDRELGRILEALEKTGEVENTYVILSSDHGLAVGQHGLMGKQNLYEHSVRVPLVVSGPGLSRGRKVTNKVYLQSLFATTCELASIEVPSTVEFRSIAPLVNGLEYEGGEDYIFGAYKHFQRMIRSDKYKLIVYPHLNKIQLFDMQKDPYETNDLILTANDSDKAIAGELLKKLIIKQQQLGDYLILDIAKYNL